MNKTVENKKETKKLFTLNNIGKLIAIVFLLFMIIVSLITLVTGLYNKVNSLHQNGDFYVFFRRNLAIVWVSIIFTIFTVGLAIVTNKLFIDCPEYKENKDHKWFKYSIFTQIIDVLVSIIIIILGKHWISIIMSNSIDNLNNFKYFKMLNIVYNDEELAKQTSKQTVLNIKAKSGNITTAFITLLFQRKLKNKLNYLVTMIN